MSQLPVDCLNEIFEYLEGNKIALYSCLLVNRLWCKISVRILWRIIRNYNTLIACLPDESKEILFRNKIITSTLILKPPIFNYVSFCKSISVYNVNRNIRKLLEQQQHILSQNLEDNICILSQEIFKLLMSQTFLKKLNFLIQNITFTSYPGARDCLKDISELSCRSNICPEFFYQLSQICKNIQSLDISFEKGISNGLADLISAQKNLKKLHIFQSYDCENSKYIITLLEKIPNTLIELDIYGGSHDIPLSFVAKFTNLQVLALSFWNISSFEDFKKLQYITFPQLESLEFSYQCPRNELLIKFLENNGRNLKEFYICDNEDSLHLAIIKFCPNLRQLSTWLASDDLETLKMIFNSSQYLESVKICCDEEFFSEKDLFDIVTNYSPKNFCKLELNYSNCTRSELLPEELESFFINWENRIPQKLFSLIIVGDGEYSLNTNDENKKIIEKYIKLGIIEFEILDC